MSTVEILAEIRWQIVVWITFVIYRIVQLTNLYHWCTLQFMHSLTPWLKYELKTNLHHNLLVVCLDFDSIFKGHEHGYCLIHLLRIWVEKQLSSLPKLNSGFKYSLSVSAVDGLDHNRVHLPNSRGSKKSIRNVHLFINKYVFVFHNLELF